MLSIKEAVQIVKKNIGNGDIQYLIEYKNLYVFIFFTSDPYEGQMDPYYSVDMHTGEFRDFAYLDDNVFEEVMDMIEKAPRYKEPFEESLKTKIKRFAKELRVVNTKVR